MIPLLAAAEGGEVYKWRDSNGVIRYSDTPPPSNIKHEVYGKKGRVISTGQEALAPVEGDATVSMNKQKAALEKEFADKNKGTVKADNSSKTAPLTKEEEAAKRAKDAEELKKKEAQKKVELEIKAENCKNARASLATYMNGGRLTKTDEKGQREYLSDADIAKGRVDAQSEVDKNCN
jgi:FKBP-type peptidyl-prolyl cis-trans isomerase